MIKNDITGNDNRPCDKTQINTIIDVFFNNPILPNYFVDVHFNRYLDTQKKFRIIIAIIIFDY